MSFEQLPDVNKGIEEMNEKSRLAIIMVGSDDPEEWQEKRLISRLRKRFFPIGDIIERDQWSPLRVEIDGLSVPVEYSGVIHVNDSLNVEFKQEPLETVREVEVELEFDSVIKKEDVAPEPNDKDKIQVSFKGKLLTVRLDGKHAQSFSIKFLRKGGLNLRQLRLVEVY